MDARHTRARYDVIERRDIFGTQAREPTDLEAFRLVGTGTHPPAEYAVIENRHTRTQRLYRPGDQLIADSDDSLPLTITSIEQERVIVRRHGETFVLARAGAPDHPHATPATSETPRDATASREVLVRRGRDDEYLIDRRDMHASLHDLNRVARHIRAIPNFVDGDPTGYRVFGINSGSLFDRLGLRNGDVVRGVNTVALTNPVQALALLGDLPRERELTVDVLRGQHARTLRYEIR
jgi:general secretion pathway protein C